MKTNKILLAILFIYLILPGLLISKSVEKENFYSSGFKIVIKRFKNNSDYKGRWNIEKEIPQLLWKELKFKTHRNIIFEKNIYSDTKWTNAIIISGDIKKFKFREHIIAAYKIGGYRNYNVTIEILIRLKYKNKIKEKIFTTYISKKNIGITLFGGPGGTDDFEKNAYKELQKLNFSSNRFRRTIYGTAVKDNIEQIIRWIKKIKYK